MPGTRPRPGREQRNYVSVGQHNGFVKKLFTIEEFRILPVPVSPNYSREGPLPFRDHQVRRNAATLGTRVGDIVNGYAASMLHAGFLHIEGRFAIVIKNMGWSSVLRQNGGCRKKKHGGQKYSHRGSPGSLDV